MPVTGEALVWWHWVVFGAGLLVADLVFINIYYLLWFGLGAIGVGLFLLGWPMTPFWQQIVFFGGLSAAMLGLWLVFLRPRALASRLREAQNEMPGQAGIVVSFSHGRGVLRMQRPIGGRDVWDFAAAAARPGDRVVVASVGADGVARAEEEEISSASADGHAVANGKNPRSGAAQENKND